MANEFKLIEGGKKENPLIELDYLFRKVLCPDCLEEYEDPESELEISFHAKWNLSKEGNGSVAFLRQEDDISLWCPKCTFEDANRKMPALPRLITWLLGLPYTVFCEINENDGISIKRQLPAG